jgi:hypothetical protein
VALQLYGCVELVVDLPEEELWAGMGGTVIHIFDTPNGVYEVEFVDNNGTTIRTAALTHDQIRLRNET